MSAERGMSRAVLCRNEVWYSACQGDSFSKRDPSWFLKFGDDRQGRVLNDLERSRNASATRLQLLAVCLSSLFHTVCVCSSPGLVGSHTGDPAVG